MSNIIGDAIYNNDGLNLSQSDEGKVVYSGALVSQTSTTKNANGTYDTTTNNEIVVNVPNTYSSSDEGKVVSNGALVAQTARSSEITQSGTYDTTLNNSVTVNVSGGATPSTDYEFVGYAIPTMTSNTAPYGTASASSVAFGYMEAFRAFDGAVNTNSKMQFGWLSASNDSAPWIKYQFQTPISGLLKIVINTANNGSTATRTVYIEGQNENDEWENILLDYQSVELTFTGGTNGVAGNTTEYTFNLDTSKTCKAIRIRGTQKNYGGGPACTYDCIRVFLENTGVLPGIGYYGEDIPSDSFGENGNVYTNIAERKIYQKNNGIWIEIGV